MPVQAFVCVCLLDVNPAADTFSAPTAPPPAILGDTNVVVKYSPHVVVKEGETAWCNVTLLPNKLRLWYSNYYKDNVLFSLPERSLLLQYPNHHGNTSLAHADLAIYNVTPADSGVYTIELVSVLANSTKVDCHLEVERK